MSMNFLTSLIQKYRTSKADSNEISHFDPYGAGLPVTEKDFYDRKLVIDKILGTPDAKNHIWLIGARRIGKSSVLMEIDERIKNHLYNKYSQCFYFDLQAVETLDGLGTKIINALEILNKRPNYQYKDLLAKSVKKTIYQFFDELENYLIQHKLRFVILFDESDKIIRLVQNDQKMRELSLLFRQLQHVKIVISSCKVFYEDEKFLPFSESFRFEFIKNLSLLDSEELIWQNQRYSKEEMKSKFEFLKNNGHIISKIHSHTNGHPFLIQLLCNELCDNNNFEDAKKNIIRTPLYREFLCTSNLRKLEDCEKYILSLINSHIETPDDYISRNDLLEKIDIDEALFDDCIYWLKNLCLIKSINGDQYTIDNHFFKNWFDKKLPKSFKTEPKFKNKFRTQYADIYKKEESAMDPNYLKERINFLSKKLIPNYQKKMQYLEDALSEAAEAETQFALESKIKKNKKTIDKLQNELRTHNINYISYLTEDTSNRSQGNIKSNQDWAVVH